MADEPLMKFKLPEAVEVEGYAVEMPDGTIKVRTKDELEFIPKKEGEGEGEQ